MASFIKVVCYYCPFLTTFLAKNKNLFLFHHQQKYKKKKNVYELRVFRKKKHFYKKKKSNARVPIKYNTS